ncbi:putative triacylglycerol lipase [Medicago truncatula]|uniref:Putative triacylglycerol lipase n=1 Tax=Medicago truncatula TaxID=3880 RepID=A0A396HJ16_MEDTR|nr:putative triacylglycerol lipase [Medicago truncatula]
MQRILPRGKPGNSIPVVLQLGLFMVNNGFDVWIANTRGTKYSHGHASFSNNSSDYWNWSWDELVAYDLPATFQYVHDQTGQKLHYGTLVALAAFSKDQQLDKLRSAALLCPIAYVGQMTSPLTKDAADHFIAESLYKLGIFEFSLKG